MCYNCVVDYIGSDAPTFSKRATMQDLRKFLGRCHPPPGQTSPWLMCCFSTQLVGVTVGSRSGRKRKVAHSVVVFLRSTSLLKWGH